MKHIKLFEDSDWRKAKEKDFSDPSNLFDRNEISKFKRIIKSKYSSAEITFAEDSELSAEYERDGVKYDVFINKHHNIYNGRIHINGSETPIRSDDSDLKSLINKIFLGPEKKSSGSKFNIGLD